LRCAIGTPLAVSLVGAGDRAGILRRAGAGWLLLEPSSQPQILVMTAAVVSVRGLPVRAADAGDTDVVTSRLGLGHALRIIARDRSPVTIGLCDGSACAGTIDRVGADYLDLAEHPPGEPRRGISAVRAVTFGGVAVVRPA
jgi:hypothetical protein